MTEDMPPRRSRGRNSSPELIARLQRSRQRSLARRAAEAEREKTITAAVGEYLDSWNAIVRIEQRRDGEVARLREQIESVIADAATEVAAHERDQAAAAAAIRAQVHTDADVADLLEITRARVRQLLADYRATGAARSPGARASAPADTIGMTRTVEVASRNTHADSTVDLPPLRTPRTEPTSRGTDEKESRS
ncbi:hypothetical protein AB0L82_36445 [Nocardia sp. NPDC052001]|uniref:hypothetical protein n=1 Tax=Nocardia sp. NPDC052001 TaxID=3154853 RepID=UPI003413D5AC